MIRPRTPDRGKHCTRRTKFHDPSPVYYATCPHPRLEAKAPAHANFRDTPPPPAHLGHACRWAFRPPRLFFVAWTWGWWWHHPFELNWVSNCLSMCRPRLVLRRGFDWWWTVRPRPRLIFPAPPRNVTRRDLWCSNAQFEQVIRSSFQTNRPSSSRTCAASWTALWWTQNGIGTDPWPWRQSHLRRAWPCR